MGGAPRKDPQEKRGIYGTQGDKRNERAPGQEPRKKELNSWEGLKMISYMREQRKEFTDEDAYWRKMCQRYRPRRRRELEDIIEKEEVFLQRQAETRTGASGTCRQRGVKQKQ